MCGRFTLTTTDGETLRATFNLDGIPIDLSPRYNIAPTQNIATIIHDDGAPQNTLVRMRWGLIPSWAKDPSIGSRMINARAETVAEKPSFRAAFKRRRCLIPADGFYEWQAQPDGPKVPLYITLQDHALFGFAGLWEVWKDPASGELIHSCTIITTDANERVAPIHNRMPVILRPDTYAIWLDNTEDDTALLQDLLRPYASEAMSAYPVSREVNRAGNEGPHLIERAG